jgi:hypothetical protein
MRHAAYLGGGPTPLLRSARALGARQQHQRRPLSPAVSTLHFFVCSLLLSNFPRNKVSLIQGKFLE